MQSKSLKTISFLFTLLMMSGLVAAPLGDDQRSDPPCDLTEEALAELSAEMHKEVEALRGWKFKHPVDVGLFTVEEVRAFFKEDEKEESDRWGKSARSDVSMKMIGVMPTDCDVAKMFEKVMMAFVPDGIYDHRKKALRIVKQEGMDPASLSIRVTLAHELTHALDDQHFDLVKLQKVGGGTSDMSHVWGAVIEGSAVTLQERYSMKAKRSNRFDANKEKESRQKEMKQMKDLFEAPPCVALFIARFPCGVRFLHRGGPKALFKLVAGSDDPGSVADAVRTAASNLPRSSEQILHPEKYWQSEQRDEPVLVNDKEVEKLLAAKGLHIVHRDTMGELLSAVLTSPEDRKVSPMAMGMPGYWTNTAATGWGGDRFFLLAPRPVEENAAEQPESLCGLWFTMWDTPEDRDEFVDAYKKHRFLPSRSILELGRLGAVFFFDFNERSRKSLEESLKTKPLQITCDGKPWSFTG
jgi:hypothetical protein